VTAAKISKYPKTEFDFTFIWGGLYADLTAKLDGFKDEFVLNRRLSAVYLPEAASGGARFTVTFTVGSFEKTLTGDEISAVHAGIMRFAEQSGLQIIK
jgi:hypothetical protein